MFLHLSVTSWFGWIRNQHKLDGNGRAEQEALTEDAGCICQEQHSRRPRPRCQLIWISACVINRRQSEKAAVTSRKNTASNTSEQMQPDVTHLLPAWKS